LNHMPSAIVSGGEIIIQVADDIPHYIMASCNNTVGD